MGFEMHALRDTNKRRAALSAVAVACFVSTTLAVTAETPSSATSPHSMQHEALINQQLAHQREFVAGALAQSQAVLTALLLQSHTSSYTNFQFAPDTRGPITERISEFSSAQEDLISEYAQGMRLRNAQIAGEFSDHLDARALMFFQAGSLYGPPELEFEAPNLPSPIAPPDISVPFPGLTAPLGGFFATLDTNP